MAKFNALGHHVPDPRPVEAPSGLLAPLSLKDEILRYIRQEMSQRARNEGHETWEEANDFDGDFDDDFPEDTIYTFQPMTKEVGDPGDASVDGPPRASKASDSKIESEASPAPAGDSGARPAQ